MLRFRFSSFILFIFLLIGCSSVEQAVVDGEVPQKDAIEQQEEKDKNLEELLSKNRSKLSDVHASHQHDIPASFLQRDTNATQVERNPFDGYRVQILSTRDIALADSISKEYRIWADTTMTSYQPKSYVFFNQPFYKVHIGDFQDQEKALKLSDILKRKYPEAWVVHDRINPSLVPADSVKMDSLFNK
ncbi:MAG: SPOR domain-containing protein [Balneolaceae bacterium]|nr:SPOR domain-containing protein [Balneolaceae bacterium]